MAIVDVIRRFVTRTMPWRDQERQHKRDVVTARRVAVSERHIRRSEDLLESYRSAGEQMNRR